MKTSIALFLFVFVRMIPGQAAESPQAAAHGLLAEIAAMGRMSTPMPAEPTLDLVQQDYYDLAINQSVNRTPMKIGERGFEHGIGQHAVGHLRVWSPEPIARFTAWVGMDRNERTIRSKGKIGFSVKSGDQVLFKSGPMGKDDEARQVDVDAGGAHQLDLWLDDGGDGHAYDHGDWAEAAITTAAGKTLRLDELKQAAIPVAPPRLPLFVHLRRPAE